MMEYYFSGKRKTVRVNGRARAVIMGPCSCSRKATRQLFMTKQGSLALLIVQSQRSCYHMNLTCTHARGANSPRCIWGFCRSFLPPPCPHWRRLVSSSWTEVARWCFASESEVKTNDHDSCSVRKPAQRGGWLKSHVISLTRGRPYSMLADFGWPRGVTNCQLSDSRRSHTLLLLDNIISICSPVLDDIAQISLLVLLRRDETHFVF